MTKELKKQTIANKKWEEKNNQVKLTIANYEKIILKIF